jgi:hypothetical protein
MPKGRSALHLLKKLHFRRCLAAAGQLVLLCLVALLLTWPAPLDGHLLPGAWVRSDLVVSHWPMAQEIQRTVAQGRPALWNPYFDAGLPLEADPLAAFFYPLTLLVHVLSLRDYFFTLIILHLVLAGLGTLLLARRALGLPVLPALVAAIAYMATPRLIAHLGAGHITIMQTVTWYPWLALTTWATVCRSWRWGPALALCVAMLLLAGHPQMAYYGLLMMGALLIWLVLRRWQREGKQAWRNLAVSVAAVACALTLGLALAAPHLLPLKDLTTYSTRAFALNSADTYRLPDFLKALITIPSPQWLVWEGMIAPGLSVLVLAVLAIVPRWRQALPLLLGIVLVAAMAMGQASLFYQLMAHVLPELDRFRGLARIWFLGLLGFALLAGLGAAWLGDLLRRFSRLGSVLLGVLLTLMVAVSLIVTDVNYNHVGDVRAITTPSPLARAASELAGGGRVYDLQENITQLLAVELQLHLANGGDPLLIASYVSYMDRAGGYYASGYQLYVPYDAPWVHPNAQLLGLMHISVIVSKRPLQDSHFLLAKVVDGIYLYKNTADAGAAYLLQPGADGQPPSLDHYQFLDAQIIPGGWTEDEYHFTVNSASGGYFVIATPAFPGWIAFVDGRSVPVKMFGGLMPALAVGPGRHTVSYVYRPASVLRGALLCGLGLLALLVWVLLGHLYSTGRLRRLRRSPPSGSPSLTARPAAMAEAASGSS